MAMKFSPKILGLSVGMFGTIFSQNSGNEKWTKPRQVQGGVEAG